MSRIKTMLMIASILLMLSCRQSHKGKQMPPLSVRVATVTSDSLYSRVTVASQVEGLYSAVIQPRVNGFLESICFQGGMPVKKGALLFTIDPSLQATSLYSAMASVESALAQERLAQSNYERAEPLSQIDAISQSDLDQYRATYKAAKAATKSAQEELRRTQDEIGYTKIVAPIGGVVAKTAAALGDYVGPGTLLSELTTITFLDTVCVDVTIPTTRYLRYSGGEGSFDNRELLSDIVMTLSDSTTYSYKGKYYYTKKDTPSSTSTVAIVVQFPNPDLLLKEGMFARISANIGLRRAALRVPVGAVSQLQGQSSVWVVAPDSTAQWRRVTLGARDGDMWEVSEGLSLGEKVVVGGTTRLHNGVKVAAVGAKKEE